MGSLFNFDGKFMRKFTTIIDSLLLGVLWLICSLPLITAGAASTAFYYAFNKSILREQGYPTREFFRGFKEGFKQATVLWLIIAVLILVLLLNIYVLTANVLPLGLLAPFLLVVSIVMLVLTIMWALCGFPYFARFENTVKSGLKTSFILTAVNFYWALLLVALFAGAVYLFFQVPIASLFAPAIYMFFANMILERIFRKYADHDDWNAQFE